MKFNVNQQDLQQALSYCQGVIEKRSTLPILSNVLLDVRNSQLTITATDLDLIFVHQIKNIEVITIKKAGINPIIFKFCNLVFVPTAAIAINKHQLLSWLEKYFIEFGKNPNEFINATAIKKIIKWGIKGVLVPILLIFFCLFVTKEIINTIGKSNATLNSFIRVAVSPVSSEIVKPAPITCATS